MQKTITEKIIQMPLSQSLKYRLISQSLQDNQLLTYLDTNPRNREFFPNGALTEQDIPAMLERFVRGYEKYQAPVFMIFDKNDNFIGRAGFAYTQELDAIEIGYIIDHKYWGKGYATEIVITLLSWAKNNLSHNEIFAFTPVNHLASIKVMQKAQMEFVDIRVLKGIECVLYTKSLT